MFDNDDEHADAWQAFLVDRRHLDFEDCNENQAKLFDYLRQHDAEITANTLALAYADLKSKGELILAPKQAPIPAQQSAAAPMLTAIPTRRGITAYRNGQPIDIGEARSL